MAFTFDASALADKSVVVFEQCYDGERLVAAHADIADANQTVEVYADGGDRRLPRPRPQGAVALATEKPMPSDEREGMGS